MISAKEGAIVAVSADGKVGGRYQIKRQQKNYGPFSLYVNLYGTICRNSKLSERRDEPSSPGFSDDEWLSENAQTTPPSTGVDSTIATS